MKYEDMMIKSLGKHASSYDLNTFSSHKIDLLAML